MRIRDAACPLLLAAMLATGLNHQWNLASGRGVWAAGVRPLSGSAALDFAALALFLVIAMRAAGDRLRRNLPIAMAVALAAAQTCFSFLAWPVVTASMPWGVDHPSFMYRLHEVRATFPALGGWSPWWNAGAEHWFGVTSGVHGWAFLVSPLLAFFEPDAFEAPAIFFWLFIGFPWLSVLVLKMCGARWASALAGGFIVTACDRAMFLYAWQYGIVGGLTTYGLTLPLCAMAYRVVALRRATPLSALALAVLAWLSCIWTPGVFTCAGLVLSALLFLRSRSRKSAAGMFGAAIAAILLLSPWLAFTLGPSRAVVKYVAANAGHVSPGRLLQYGFGRFGVRLLEWHPVALSFGLCGVVFAAPRRLHRFMAPVLAVLAAAVLAIMWKRQSQFDRVAFQMSAAAAFPAALICGRLLSRKPRGGAAAKWGIAFAQGVVLAALFAGLRIAGAHAANAAGFPMRTASADVLAFADWIRDNVPEDGRLAFMGIMDNHLGGGTVAYLPIMTGREMMGDDYYTFPRGMTERNFPPRSVRASTQGVLDFSRAFGITHWATWHPRYIRFFEEESDHFEFATSIRDRGPEIRVYRLREPPAGGRFLKGAGTVEARENHIAVRPQYPSAGSLVLRYRWRDGLVCKSPGAGIGPFPLENGVTLVEVHPNGLPLVEIGYSPRFRALAPDPGGFIHH